MAKSAKPSVDENAVRDRAYLMWEADGRPDGRSEHYWGLAHAEALAPAKSKRAAASAKPAPEKRRKPTKVKAKKKK